MEIFAEDPLVQIVGIAEIRPRTSGVLLGPATEYSGDSRLSGFFENEAR